VLLVRLRIRFEVFFASCAELDAIVWVSEIRARDAMMERDWRLTTSLSTEAHLLFSSACCGTVEEAQLTKNEDSSDLLYLSWPHRSADHLSHVNVSVGSNVALSHVRAKAKGAHR
jgi:hypothetical protein